jgi:hypothetical protein
MMRLFCGTATFLLWNRVKPNQNEIKPWITSSGHPQPLYRLPTQLDNCFLGLHSPEAPFASVDEFALQGKLRYGTGQLPLTK